MRIRITPYYSKEASPEFPFWYKSTLNGETVVSNGTSWDEAKERHVQKLSDMLIAPIPPIAEDVEI